MEKIAIVGPVDEKGKNEIKKELGESFEIIEITDKNQYNKLEDVEYIILRTLTLDKDEIKKAKKLKFIQRWGVGYDSVDIEAAANNNVKVAVASGINSVPVAEYAILLILSVYRNIIKIHSNVLNGKWREPALIGKSYLINNKKIGSLGLGKIGKKVAKIISSFGVEILYNDLNKLSIEEEKEINIKYVDFDELISKSDIISLHLPLVESTKNIINKEVISKMKKTAVIINTARGGIINEEDLYEALSNNRILGAGLDVFEEEPISKNNKLLQLDNVVLSAHSSGNTTDNSMNMAKRCVENILKVCNNEELSIDDFVNAKHFNK